MEDYGEFIETSIDGKITFEFILNGIIFYQSKVENETRYLLCHGPASIYRNVLDTIVNK